MVAVSGERRLELHGDLSNLLDERYLAGVDDVSNFGVKLHDWATTPGWVG